MSNTQKAHQQQQLELALAVTKTNHPFSYTDHSMIQWVKSNDHLTPYKLLTAGRHLRLDFIQPSDGTLRNPHNLSANQVGAGYRLVTHYEAENNIHQEHAEIWFGDVAPTGWRKFSVLNMKANWGASIRVPISCPITTGPDASPPSNIEYQNRDGLPSAGFGYRFATKFETANNIHQEEAEFFSYNKKWKKFQYSSMSQNFGCSIRVPQSCTLYTEPVKPVAPPIKPLVKLEAKDILPGSRIRDPDWDDDEYEMTQSVFTDRIYTATGRYTYKSLMEDKWLIQYPGGTWQPCHKQS